MKEVLIVKHAVGGRTFIHSEQHSTEYSVTGDGTGWIVKIHITPEVSIEEIMNWKNELNVFLFQDFEDQPTIKIWFYVKEGPVIYDEHHHVLTIHAESRLEYVPSEFGI